jgi:hypothetical protein
MSLAILANSGNILATENLVDKKMAIPARERKLSTLEEGKFFTLQKVPPTGALQARKQSSVVSH